MTKKRISERKVILFTAAFLILSGLFRLFAYSFGVFLFYFAFAPYLLFRLVTIIRRRKEESDSTAFYRIIVLFVMIASIVLNIVGWQEADFFLIFLLMVDYLLMVNKRF